MHALDFILITYYFLCISLVQNSGILNVFVLWYFKPTFVLNQMFCYISQYDCVPQPITTYGFLQGPSSQWVDVMKKKREVHEKIIHLVHQQRSNNNVEKVDL